MSVIQLDIYAADDPLGSALVTLTDADVAEFEMRLAENSLGAGSFSIRRDHASATPANLAVDNYVVVTIPAIDPDPVFGFWLEHHDDTILSSDEEGGEILVRQGPGSLAILGRAAFLDQHYATVPPASDDRGSGNEIPGYWRWQHKQYGQILVRLIEEGQTEPGTPLEDVTIDFDRDVDSDGVDWPAIDRDVRFEIGTDGLTFLERFAATGEVFVTCSPGLLVQARQARGTDRTSATFATGKVRLVKGVNIQTELVRSGDTSLAATHAIVEGMEDTYVQVVSPSYVSGPGKWLRVPYDNSNDTGVLEKVGREALARGVTDLQEITMEIRAGDDEANGHYLPFKHFNVSDLITVHTGTDTNDYNEQSERVRAFTIALREASDDTTLGLIDGDEMAARSLIVGVECGGVSGNFGIDLSVAAVDEKGCGGCPPPPPITNPPDVTGYSCTARDSSVYSYTEGGERPPLGFGLVAGIYEIVSTDFIQYNVGAGSPAASEYPTAGLVQNWGNGGVCDGVFTSGGVDYGTGGIPTVMRFTMVGPGTLVVHTAVHPGGHVTSCGTSGTITATAQVAGLLGVVDTDSQPAGSDLTIVIPVDGECAHYVDVQGATGPWGFGGANWTPLFTATPVADQEVRDTFTGDGTTTSYTTPASVAYRAGSMHIKVGGLDWTASLNETDPTTGTYTLDYAPPVGATVEVWFTSP